MSPEAQRIAIAETCGWRIVQEGEFYTPLSPDGLRFGFWSSAVAAAKNLPDYLQDLNAIHKAEKTLTIHNYAAYERALSAAVDEVGKDSDIWHYVLCATAAQRAEAFLRTIGKWEQA